MGDVPLVRTTRRRFWLCILSVFLGGLVCGSLVGMYGLRFLYLHYPPPIDKMAERISRKVQRDFELDEATRKRVRAEIAAMALNAHKRLAEVNDDTKDIIQRHTESIADIMPNTAARDRWLREAGNYIPVPPPIPPPPARPSFTDETP